MIARRLRIKWKDQVSFPNVSVFDYVKIHRIKRGRVQYIFTENLPEPIMAFGKKYWIRKGFKWDGGSIPRGLWGLFSPMDEKTLWSTLTHDLLFTIQTHSFMETNILLYKMLMAEGSTFIRAVSYLFATTLFGWIPWKKHAEFAAEVRALYIDQINN